MDLRTRRRLRLAILTLGLAVAGAGGVDAARGQPASMPAAVEPATAGPTSEPTPGNEASLVDAPAAPVPDENDLPAYPVSAFELRYATPAPGLPSIESLLDAPIDLGETDAGYVLPPSMDAAYLAQRAPDQPAPKLPRPGVRPVRTTLRALGAAEPKTYYASAIWAINAQLVRRVNDAGVVGVFVSPDPEQITDRGDDVRAEDDRRLSLVIATGTVAQLRSVAAGDRIAPDARVNNPAHARILRNSPLKAGAVVERKKLEDYAALLNRLPGRRVDVALTASDTPGAVNVDYLIAERRSVLFYAQVSNTGTSQTSDWRERFGVIWNQPAKRDDVLSIDYSTAGFSDSHALVLSYETPLGSGDRLRLRTFGIFNDFTASDVGLPGFDYTGQEYSGGVELSYNVLQRNTTFVDLVAGVRYSHYDVDNGVLGSSESAGYVMPSVGVRLERNTDSSSTAASLSVLGAFTGADESDLLTFGRTDPSTSFASLQLFASHSFYVEPLLNPTRMRESPEKVSLANELYFAVRGQYAFGARLIPQQQAVVGGLDTVRGYEEAQLPADSFVCGTAEYRFHVAQSLGVQPDPYRTPLFGKPFRFARQYPFGRPDWDLILRGFVDAGYAAISDASSIESSDALVGAGVGVELLFKENVSLRVDWAAALTDAGSTEAGDSRVHVVATFSY